MLLGFNFAEAKLNTGLDALFVAQVFPVLVSVLMMFIGAGVVSLLMAKKAERAIMIAFWHGVTVILLFQLTVLLAWLYFAKGMYLSSLAVALATLVVSKIEFCFFLKRSGKRKQML